MITIDQLRGTLSEAAPPAGTSPALQALWWAGKGDWDRAHECVQAHEGEADCDLVHAHLHRQEGDLGNAAYWYRRARASPASGSLPQEWHDIAQALLTVHGGGQAGVD